MIPQEINQTKNRRCKMFYQQGDVIVEKTNQIKGKKLDHSILASGEVTGHHHQITEGEVELYDHEGTLFLRVNSESAILTHQEHKPITLPKGDFIVRRVREYDHFAEETKQVRD